MFTYEEDLNKYPVWYGDWCLLGLIKDGKKYIMIRNRFDTRRAVYWVDIENSLYLKENFGLKKYLDTDYVEEAINKVYFILFK